MGSLLKDVEATKIFQIGICGCTIQWTKFPDQNIKKKYTWQKEHKENKTGTKERHKPVKIKKNNVKKNMKPGNKIFINLFIFNFIKFRLC